MVHETVFNLHFRCLIVEENAYLASWNIEVVGEPAFHIFGVVAARLEVPNSTRFIVIYPDNQRKYTSSHLQPIELV